MLKRIFRAVLLVALAFLMIGFGLCGAMGVFSGIQNSVGGGPESGMPFLMFGLLALGIAFLCWLGVSALSRKLSSGD